MSDTPESPQQFRKKPVVIEAMRWDGGEECLQRMLAFVDFAALPDDGTYVGGAGIGYVPALGTMDIPTLEGTMTASAGDWIIRGGKGEFYPCKPDIFEATYEPADGRGIHVETYEAGVWRDKNEAVMEHGSEYRWRVRHSNGEVMGSGEGYADARDRDHAVQVLFPGVPTKEVEG